MLRRFTTLMSSSISKKTLESLNFDNLALKALPIDPVKENFVRKVPGACFSIVDPTPVENPRLVCAAPSALELVDLGRDQIDRPDFADYLSGNKILPGARPAAHCYCGHQFGYFSGQLGDGATMYLGEVLNEKGERWEIQFKGAGKTPYSRQADGRKVLRSSIREFLASEAVHHLGIPTTRCGCVVTSDTLVVRDIFYDGNALEERASIILRIAPSFLRFGSFEIFKPMDAETGREGPSAGRKDILIKMLDYTVSTFYADIWARHGSDRETAYLEFYREVVKRTAKLVALWQSVGFCHGVLNTDNMSILGLTIDYGPYGFMQHFNPKFICNGSDDEGRYTYEKQPEMCRWNCLKLAEAIQMAVPLSLTRDVLEAEWDRAYDEAYLSKMRNKLGLLKERPVAEDKALISSLLSTMQQTGADWTNTFRALALVPPPSSAASGDSDESILEKLIGYCGLAENPARRIPQQLLMLVSMAQSNPAYLRQLGISVEMVMEEFERFKSTQTQPTLSPCEKIENDRKAWSKWLSEYRARLGHEYEGCPDIAALHAQRTDLMNANNPKFVLRNQIAQQAIERAEIGDFSEVRKVLEILSTPYDDRPEIEPFYSAVPDQSARKLRVT